MQIVTVNRAEGENVHILKTACKDHTYKTAKIPSITSKAVDMIRTILIYPRDVIEGIFAVLYVSHMGLTLCYKTVVFLHLLISKYFSM